MMHHTHMSALRATVLVLLTAWGGVGHAVGLGPVQIHSKLGEPLKVSIALLGADAADILSNCVKSKLESSNAVFLATLQPRLGGVAHAPTLLISSPQKVDEPAVVILVDIGCGTPIHRSYQILLDPIELFQSAFESQLLALVSTPPKPDKRASANSFSAHHKAAKEAALQAAQSKTALPKSGKQFVESKNTVSALSGNVKKTARNVLKLSGDENLKTNTSAVFGLKLSKDLSETDVVSTSRQTDELHTAQARFAALLRGEDLTRTVELKLQTVQERIQALQKENARMMQQSVIDKAALKAMQEKTFSLTWIAGLGGLLLASLGALGWLGWRFSHTKKIGPNVAWGGKAAARKGALPALPELNIMTRTGKSRKKTNASADLLNDQPPPVTLPVEDFSEQSYGFFNDASSSPGIDDMDDALDSIAMVNVEEISDAVQEAEFWMLLHDPLRAIDILEPYEKVERPDSPVPWIYLLDLYREIGARTKYELLVGRFKHVFNAQLAPWSQGEQTQPVQCLEDFPHLVMRISELWNDDEKIVPFLESLLFDDRQGARKGFALGVYRDIMMLIGLAHEFARSTRPGFTQRSAQRSS
jgi:pilus assembly protein FimV